MSKETYDALDAAIRAHTADETDGDYAVDWVVCIAAVHSGSTGGTNYGYNLSGGYKENMPSHRVIGLLDFTRHLILTEDDDD